jgi:hypothetical protein
LVIWLINGKPVVTSDHNGLRYNRARYGLTTGAIYQPEEETTKRGRDSTRKIEKRMREPAEESAWRFDASPRLILMERVVPGSKISEMR